MNAARLKGARWRSLRALALLPLQPARDAATRVTAVRLKQNPLITVETSPSLGDNVNGPSIIRVPSWIPHPLGRYYAYFGHHKGQFIRLAYADAIAGPWKVYEPGVVPVGETAFYRPQPDPPDGPVDQFYTHVASPEIYVDEAHRRLVLWTHGWWTNSQRWPLGAAEARAWARQNGYGQFTQSSESTDGLHFTLHPAITKVSYLRVFPHDGYLYGMARLGQLLRSKDPLASFEIGPNPFAGWPVRRSRPPRRDRPARPHAVRVLHRHRRRAGARDAVDDRSRRRLERLEGVGAGGTAQARGAVRMPGPAERPVSGRRDRRAGAAAARSGHLRRGGKNVSVLFDLRRAGARRRRAHVPPIHFANHSRLRRICSRCCIGSRSTWPPRG